MDLDPGLGVEVPFDESADDDGMGIDLTFHLSGFSHDEGPALKDLPLESTFQAKDALKGHLPFKRGFSSQKGADIFRNGRRFDLAFCEERFCSRHNGLLSDLAQTLHRQVKDKVEIKTEVLARFS